MKWMKMHQIKYFKIPASLQKECSVTRWSKVGMPNNYFFVDYLIMELYYNLYANENDNQSKFALF
jgi:hypothetical protein